MTGPSACGIAVIGAGFIADYHVAGLRAAGAEVSVLVGRSAERTARRAAALGIVRTGTDPHAVFADPAIAAVVIATPDDTHLPLARAALEAGKHVLLQKPMALDSAGAGALLAIDARAGRRLSVSFMHRHFPEVRWLRDLLATGRLGPIHAVRIRNATPGADWGDWFFTPGQVSGGVAMQLGVHGIDLVQHLFGPIATLAADLATARPERRLADGRTVRTPFEDTVLATYRLTGGVPVSHEMSYTETAGCDRFRLEVYGEHGTVWLRTERGAAAICAPSVTGEAGWVVPVLAADVMGADHHRHWLERVTGAAPPDDTAEAGLSSLLVAETIYAAAREGRRLTVPGASS